MYSRCWAGVEVEVEQGLGVAPDERERGPELVADRRDEALAELLERPDGADVAEDRGRPDRAAGRRRRRASSRRRRGPDCRRPPDRGLAIADRHARRDDLGERAVGLAVAARRLAAEDVARRSVRAASAVLMPSSALAGRVEPDDPAVASSTWRITSVAPSTIGTQLVPLALERLSQARLPRTRPPARGGRAGRPGGRRHRGRRPSADPQDEQRSPAALRRGRRAAGPAAPRRTRRPPATSSSCVRRRVVAAARAARAGRAPSPGAPSQIAPASAPASRMSSLTHGAPRAPRGCRPTRSAG